MKKLWMILMTVGLMVAASSLVAAETKPQPAKVEEPKAMGHPRVQFDKLVYDFGTTSMVQSLTGTFTFQNKGDSELEVRKPSTSCGCTVAAVKPEKLAPGQSGELVFTLNVSGMARGSLEKHITVPSNDNTQPAVQLAVKANIVSLYEVAPSQISFGDLRAGTATNLTLIVKRIDGTNLALGNLQPSGNLIRAKAEPVNPATAKVTIEVAAQGAPRRLSENIVLFSGDNTQQIALVPVYGRIVGDVAVSPETVFWGINDPGNWPGAFPEVVAKRTLRVALTGGDKKLEINDLASTVRDLELNLTTIEAGKTYEIIARLLHAPKETVAGEISFTTGVPNQPKAVVPVVINVLRPQPPALPGPLTTEKTDKK